MEIKKIGYDFSVCKVVDYSLVDFNKEFMFAGKTDEEVSLVCLTSDVPSNITERGWLESLPNSGNFRFFIGRNFIDNFRNFSRK